MDLPAPYQGRLLVQRSLISPRESSSSRPAGDDWQSCWCRLDGGHLSIFESSDRMKLLRSFPVSVFQSIHTSGTYGVPGAAWELTLAASSSGEDKRSITRTLTNNSINRGLMRMASSSRLARPRSASIRSSASVQDGLADASTAVETKSNFGTWSKLTLRSKKLYQLMAGNNAASQGGTHLRASSEQPPSSARSTGEAPLPAKVSLRAHDGLSLAQWASALSPCLGRRPSTSASERLSTSSRPGLPSSWLSEDLVDDASYAAQRRSAQQRTPVHPSRGRRSMSIDLGGASPGESLHGRLAGSGSSPSSAGKSFKPNSSRRPSSAGAISVLGEAGGIFRRRSRELLASSPPPASSSFIAGGLARKMSIRGGLNAASSAGNAMMPPPPSIVMSSSERDRHSEMSPCSRFATLPRALVASSPSADSPETESLSLPSASGSPTLNNTPSVDDEMHSTPSLLDEGQASRFSLLRRASAQSMSTGDFYRHEASLGLGLSIEPPAEATGMRRTSTSPLPKLNANVQRSTAEGRSLSKLSAALTEAASGREADSATAALRPSASGTASKRRPLSAMTFVSKKVRGDDAENDAGTIWRMMPRSPRSPTTVSAAATQPSAPSGLPASVSLPLVHVVGVQEDGEGKVASSMRLADGGRTSSSSNRKTSTSTTLRSFASRVNTASSNEREVATPRSRHHEQSSSDLSSSSEGQPQQQSARPVISQSHRILPPEEIIATIDSFKAMGLQGVPCFEEHHAKRRSPSSASASSSSSPSWETQAAYRSSPSPSPLRRDFTFRVNGLEHVEMDASPTAASTTTLAMAAAAGRGNAHLLRRNPSRSPLSPIQNLHDPVPAAVGGGSGSGSASGVGDKAKPTSLPAPPRLPRQASSRNLDGLAGGGGVSPSTPIGKGIAGARLVRSPGPKQALTLSSASDEPGRTGVPPGKPSASPAASSALPSSAQTATATAAATTASAAAAALPIAVLLEAGERFGLDAGVSVTREANESRPGRGVAV